MTEEIIRLRDKISYKFMEDFRRESKQNDHLHPWIAAEMGYRRGFDAAVALCEREKEIAVVEAKLEMHKFFSVELNSWMDLLEMDHRAILDKMGYSDPQEASREYMNKQNLLQTINHRVLTSIKDFSAQAAKLRGKP